jgi:hypothetical protein
MSRLILAGFLAAFSFSACASDLPIAWREAQHASAQNLALRSFAQVVSGFSKKSTFIVPTDGGHALFSAEFSQPMVEYFPGLCRGKIIEFQYDWNKGGGARANRMNTTDVYAALDPAPTREQNGRDDKETKARCAALSGLKDTFTADTVFNPAAIIQFLTDARTRAAADKPGTFSLSCIGSPDECTAAKQVLATLDLKRIQQMRGCDDDWFGEARIIHCGAALLTSNVPGPDFWTVKVDVGLDSGSSITAVTMRAGHVNKPL